MDKGSLFIVSAPSGAGKTSLLKVVCDRVEGLGVSVSHTTRDMRPGEVNGLDYHFTDKASFDAKIANDEFLEYAKVFDNYYGTSTQHVEQRLASGNDVILEIDWQGAQQVRQKKPRNVSVFILPPSREVLEQRLSSRGQDSEDVIARRMRDAIAEMSHYDEFDYIIINDDFDTAVEEFVAIVKSQRLMTPGQIVKQAQLISNLMEPLINS